MRVYQRIFFILGIVLTILLFVVLVFEGSSQSVFCGSCHIMREPSSTWVNAPHSKVACVDCHLPKSIPDKMLAKVAKGIPQLFNNIFEDPELKSGSGRPANEVCLRCHDNTRYTVSRNGIRISHKNHSKEKGSCSQCHWETTHADDDLSAKAKMELCIKCHKEKEATEECDSCHIR